MKKSLAVIFIALGLFYWFRFATDCFPANDYDRSGDLAGVALKNNLSEISQPFHFTKRPVHTNSYGFTFSPAFNFISDYFVNTFVGLFAYKFHHQAVLSFHLLRAPPVTL